MAFCTPSDFTGQLLIDTSSPEMLTFLNESIDRVEKLILVNYSLGYQLYTEFIAGLAEDTPLQKWLDLKDGKEFTVNYYGKPFLIKWGGLANMLKYFVYFDFWQNINNNPVILATVRQLTQNAETQTPVYHLSQMYNMGSFFNGQICKSTSVHMISPTLFSFMYTTNEAAMTYENWLFKEVERINGFSL